MERVDFFLPVRTQYGVIHHFTEKLAEAMRRQGMTCRVFDPHDQENIIRSLIESPPDMTCAFNGLLPDEKGAFLADNLRIPHLAYLVDSPHHFLPLLQSKYTVISCDDQMNRQFFQDMGSNRVLFLPHAVDRGLFHYYDNERSLDVILLGTHIDPESVRRKSRDILPGSLTGIVEEVAEQVLAKAPLTCMEAVTRAIAEREEVQAHVLEVLELVEQYVRGKARCDLVRSLSGVRVHVYGNVYGDGSWDSMTRGCDHVELHGAVAFDEAIRLMTQAKVVLNTCPRIKFGGHERIFTGMACGALVFTEENPWMREAFTEGVDVAFFSHRRISEAAPILEAYLGSDSLRQAVAAAGQENVRQNHTWDQRAEQALHDVEALLSIG